MNEKGINTFPDKKVIIIDDDNLNLVILKRFLEPYKVLVDKVSSGFDLLEKIKVGNKYDLIILDDMMPNMTGTETLAHLKQNGDFNTKTVVLTANTVDGAREKYLNAGFDEYMEKPLDKKELDRVLNKYL